MTEFESLANVAASALAASIATDGWNTLKQRVAAALQRKGRALPKIEQDLERLRYLPAAQSLLAQYILSALRDDPEAAAVLRRAIGTAGGMTDRRIDASRSTGTTFVQDYASAQIHHHYGGQTKQGEAMLRRIDRLAWVDGEESNGVLARAALLARTNEYAAKSLIEALEQSWSVRTWYIDLTTARHVWTGLTEAGRIFREKLGPDEREQFRGLLADPSGPLPQTRAMWASLLETQIQQLFLWRAADGRYAQEIGTVPGGGDNQWGEVNRSCIRFAEKDLAPDDLRTLRIAAPELFA